MKTAHHKLQDDSNDYVPRCGILPYLVLFLLLGSLLGATYMLKNQFFFASHEVKSAVGVSQHQWPGPPPHGEYAKTARYVLHISEWGSLATFSTHKGIESYPFVNVFSVSDGSIGNSTGIPYFYLTELELSVKDLKHDSRASLTVSEAQSDYCQNLDLDPEDPRCAHVIFSGNILRLLANSSEEAFAKEALFSRHPEMSSWPIGHQWFFAKLNINHIYVLDYFGGAAVVDVPEYLASKPW